MKTIKAVTMENLEKFLAGNEGVIFETDYNDEYYRECRVYEVKNGVLMLETSGKKYGDPSSRFKKIEELSPEKTLEVILKYPKVFKYGMI